MPLKFKCNPRKDSISMYTALLASRKTYPHASLSLIVCDDSAEPKRRKIVVVEKKKVLLYTVKIFLPNGWALYV